MKPQAKNAWRKQFIKTLKCTGNVSKAAKSAKRSRDTVYRHKRHSPKFSAAWDSAIEEATSLFEDELNERCLDRDAPGSHVLLIFKLKALKPELYRDQYTPRPQSAVEPTLEPEIAAAVLQAARGNHVRLASIEPEPEPEPDPGPDPESGPEHLADEP